MIGPVTENGPGSALAQRLSAASRVLLPDRPRPAGGVDADDQLLALVTAVCEDPASDTMWLLYTALTTVMPDERELRALRRRCELRAPDDVAHWLLGSALDVARRHGAPDLDLDIVSDAVVVDVDVSARLDLHTGIQRVVRSTLPRWDRDHDVLPVAWTAGRGTFRALVSAEARRVLRWGEPGAPVAPDPGCSRLVVPWRSTVVLPEVPGRDVCGRLAALAAFSGNRVVAVGHDAIPVVSADLVPAADSARFVQYLAVVRRTAAVAGVSASATTEFAGLCRMVGARESTGPRVSECALPVDRVVAAPVTPPHELPSMVCVGRFEPRKNQAAVLDAAERLWREGLRFRLTFIGNGGSRGPLTRSVRRHARRGRAVSVMTGIDEPALAAVYRSARFSVFISLHEGYGLPVAESLAHGTPVLTTEYGSTAEFAADGGTVVVDPRDDDAVVAAMRRLLVDDDLIATLEAQIAERPHRTWDDYAAELWGTLVEGQGAGS